MDDKLVFISYSHADKDIAKTIANELVNRGINVWWDQWDLQPGDSLISKIFEFGLAKASHFLILLSPSSVRSSWVKEELSIATIRRIEEVVRVIPVLVDGAEIPTPLRSLLWVDLRSDFNQGVDRIANSILEISSKPSVRPQTPLALIKPVGNLSKAATAIGLILITASSEVGVEQTAVRGNDLRERLSLAVEAVNDAVDELEQAGLVRVIRTLGTSPYTFFQVEPTYVLYREFRDSLTYDPDSDVRQVAALVAAQDQVDGPAVATLTGLDVDRINLAVSYLDDYGLAKILKFLGTSPFTFGAILATGQTRRFVAQFG
jgi:hypothetical protein